MSIEAYPLCWPAQFPRAKWRDRGRFKVSLSVAMENVERSLRGFAKDSHKPVSNVVISSNVTLGTKAVGDPGVAVWFTWDGMSLCIPVDRYDMVSRNLQAVHKIIEARRTELRHGSLTLVKATFTGFTSLPPPRGWRKVFGYSAGARPPRDRLEADYKAIAFRVHPDRGGSTAAMAELNNARDAAIKELGL